MKKNKTEKCSDGFYRLKPDGTKYRQCEAHVQDEHESNTQRLCRRAAAKDDRLCSYHIGLRQRINRPSKWVVTINKKGVVPTRNKWGSNTYPKFVIGKTFLSKEDAELWCSLNGTLIFAIPGCKSYCIEPAHRFFPKT